MDVNVLLVPSVAIAAAVIALVIAVTKGLTEFFKMEGKKAKIITTILVALVIYGVALINFSGDLVFTIPVIVNIVFTYLIILLGAMGIYDFIPRKAVEQAEKDMQASILANFKNLSQEEQVEVNQEMIDVLVENGDYKQHTNGTDEDEVK